MPPIILMHYSRKHRNLGDAMNPLLIEMLSGIPSRHTHYRSSTLFAVGSILGKVLGPRFNLFRRLSRSWTPELRIWTSGFIAPPAPSQVLIRNIRVCALRGKKSQDILSAISGRRYAVPLGDGGLLADGLLAHKPEKKYAVGIVPHYREESCPEIPPLLKKVPDSKLISPIGDPLEVIRQIAECETILSSSLHGLIVADSLGIPNRHVIIQNRISGYRFKFDDYYSAYGFEEGPCCFVDDIFRHGMSAELIRRQYLLSQAQIEDRKETIRNAFPLDW